MTITLAALLAYLLVQVAVGVWVSRRVTSEAGYLVADRQLGYGLATLSTMATWFGAETVVGSAGITYREGLSVMSAEPFGYGLCLVLMALIFAVPLWRRGLTTLADLFRQRYSVRVERVAAIILIPSSVLWSAAQVRAFGTVVSIAAPAVDVATGIAVAAVFTIAYTAYGGMLADAITDFMQGILLIVGLVVVGVAVFLAAGGIDGVGEALAASARARAATRPTAGAGPGWLAVAEEWAVPVLGSVIATELVTRVIATRSPGTARRATLSAGALYIVVGLIPVFIGLVGLSLVPTLADPEGLVPSLALSLLPTALFAVFAGGLVSAILSTVNSTLLVASGLLSHNLVVPLLGLTSERWKVRVARGGVLLFGVIAYWLALHADGVFALVEQASAFGSAGTLVCVTFALFTGFGGPRTAMATLLVGVVGYLLGQAAGVTAPFLLSLAAALVVYVVGGLLERDTAPLPAPAVD